MTRPLYLVTCLLVSLLVRSSAGLSCYACAGRVCRDTFDKDEAHGLIEGPCDYCEKLKWDEDESNSQTVHRECRNGSMPHKGCKNREGRFKDVDSYSSEEAKVFTCYCRSHLCNPAAPRVPYTLAVLSALIASLL